MENEHQKEYEKEKNELHLQRLYADEFEEWKKDPSLIDKWKRMPQEVVIEMVRRGNTEASKLRFVLQDLERRVQEELEAYEIYLLANPY